MRLLDLEPKSFLAAQEIPGAMQDMSNLSTKALQQFIEVVKGVPEAFEGILDDLEGFGKKMVAVPKQSR